MDQQSITVKLLPGVQCQTATISEWGFLGDHYFMIVTLHLSHSGDRLAPRAQPIAFWCSLNVWVWQPLLPMSKTMQLLYQVIFCQRHIPRRFHRFHLQGVPPIWQLYGAILFLFKIWVMLLQNFYKKLLIKILAFWMSWNHKKKALSYNVWMMVVALTILTFLVQCSLGLESSPQFL